MFVAAVAGVDDGAVDLFGEQLHGAGIRVTDNQHVRVHGVQGHRGIDDRLALFDRTGGDRHVDDVGAKAFGGQLERGARARRGFEEQIDQGAAAEHGVFLVGAAVLFDVALGGVEQIGDLVGGKAFDTEQVPVWIEARIGSLGGH